MKKKNGGRGDELPAGNQGSQPMRPSPQHASSCRLALVHMHTYTLHAPINTTPRMRNNRS